MGLTPVPLRPRAVSWHGSSHRAPRWRAMSPIGMKGSDVAGKAEFRRTALARQLSWPAPAKFVLAAGRSSHLRTHRC
jgi:hypothetical protein